MHEENVRIKIRLGANEFEIEGSITSIKETIDLLPKFIDNLSSGIPVKEQNVQEINPTVLSLEPSVIRESPEIQVEKNDSLSDIIVKMFKDSWGRQPKKLNQIRSALESYGLNYPKQSVAVALLRLAQSGKLRRFKEGGEFVYTASTGLNLVPSSENKE